MRIVIAGAGEVGTHLAKMLSDEEQDIIVMDVDNKKLEPLENYNLLTHQGCAISFSDLNAIKTGSCDLYIADQERGAQYPVLLDGQAIGRTQDCCAHRQ